MQAIIDWVTAHYAIVILVVYEVWSLLPETWVNSSSILTWIGNLLTSLKAKNPTP